MHVDVHRRRPASTAPTADRSKNGWSGKEHEGAKGRQLDTLPALLPNEVDNSGASVGDLANKAYQFADEAYGLQEAAAWPKGFCFPTTAVVDDLQLFHALQKAWRYLHLRLGDRGEKPSCQKCG